MKRMKIEVFCEDISSVEVLNQIMRQLLAERAATNQFDYFIRPHRGKGNFPKKLDQKPKRFASGLMDLLPAKMKAYAQVYQTEEVLFLVVLDADQEDPDLVWEKISQLMLNSNDFKYVIGISVEEIEAWLLGDKRALLAAYPEANQKILTTYQQDSVCGTWELLAKVIMGEGSLRLIKIGYPAIGAHKARWAKNIAPYLNISRNQSQSFQRFRKEFHQILDRIEGV